MRAAARARRPCAGAGAVPPAAGRASRRPGRPPRRAAPRACRRPHRHRRRARARRSDHSAIACLARTWSQASITPSTRRPCSSPGQLSGSTNASTACTSHAGMDLRDALAQRQRLGHAERAVQRLQLAVDVRLRHVVEVDQRQRGHAAARQRLDRPRADAAQADHGDVCVAQALIAGVAIEPPHAAEAALEIGLVGAAAVPQPPRRSMSGGTFQRHICQRSASTPPPRMPASATKLPSDSVDRPDRPCPIVQPSAVTPPTPISTRADQMVGGVLGVAKTFPVEVARGQRHDGAAEHHADRADDADASAPCWCR